MNWATIQAAIVEWVKAGSGYASGRVIWKNQSKNRPASAGAAVDHIAIQLLSLRGVGEDEVVQTQDLSRVGNGSTTVGTEILHTVRADKEMTLSVQCYTTSVVGSAQALAVLSKVQTSLRLESVRSGLTTAGVCPIDAGSLEDITGILDTDYEGRAVLTCRFSVTEEVTEFSTWIEHCDPESYMGPPDGGTSEDIDI